MKYNGKTVVITGAGNGIGKACCEAFLAEGANVIGVDIHTDGIPDDVFKEQVDISDETAVKRLFEKHPDVDVLINCAGVISLIKWFDQDVEEWERVQSVNLRGTFLCCKYAALHLREKRKGCIVSITGGAGKTGGLNVGPNYVTSKAAINALTIHFARQLAPFGVRVNAISPGPIETSMLDCQQDGKEKIIAAVPLGIGYPEDIANGAIFLADDRLARYITGEILDIDGGLFMD